MRRATMVCMAALAVVVAVGCQGVPDEAFNGGSPVLVPSWYLERGPVLRFPDGSTLVSRFDPTSGTPYVRKLDPDGSVATDWGVGGDVEVPFLQSGSSGAVDGVVLADGAVLLRGFQGPYTEKALRLTSTGAVDPLYGVAGTLLISDLFFGDPYHDTCELIPDGSITCATASPTADEITIHRYGALGADLGTVTVPVDLDQFATSGPPGSTSSFGTFVSQVAVQGDDVVLGVQVSTNWWSEEDAGSSDADIAVLRVSSGAVDPTFGSSGYRLVDLEVDGSGQLAPGAGTDSARASELAIGTDGAVTLIVSAQDTTTFDTTFGAVRLTPAGAFDPASGGDGVWSALLPDTTPVDVSAARVRPDGQVILGGSVPELSDSRGVVLRVLPTGLLDTGFSEDGVADMAGTRGVHSIDDRNGRVTVGGSGATIDGETSGADVVVQVLTG